MYELGPLVIRAEAWPTSWTTCAEQWLHPANGDEGRVAITVRCAGRTLSADDARDATTMAELLEEVRLAPRRWRIRSSGSFVAELDEEERLLSVHVRSAQHDAHLTLGNPLRAMVATTMPSLCDGLMIHACAAVVDGDDHGGPIDGPIGGPIGVIVAGLSTAGKSTLAVGLREAMPLSDDVALVVDASTEPKLAPSPFFGGAGIPGVDYGTKTPRTSPAGVPLRAIGILVGKVLPSQAEPDARSTFQLVPRARGAAELLRHVACFAHDRALSARLFELTTQLAQRVPIVLVQRSLLDSSDDVLRAILRAASSQRRDGVGERC